MNILMLSRDSTLFSTDTDSFGDSLARHSYYAELIRNIYKDSSVTIIAYNGGNKNVTPVRNRNLSILPTKSSKKYLFPIEIFVIGYGILRRKKHDVVISQTLEEDGLVAFALSRIFGIKLITQLHFDIFSQGWLKESPLNLFRKLVAKQISRRSDSIRVVSHSLREKLRSTWNVRRPIYIVPVAMSINKRFAGKDTIQGSFEGRIESIESWADRKKVVLFLGRFCAAKNLDLWLETAALLARLDDKIFFLMCGDGEDRYNCIRKARSLGIYDRCLFPGPVDYGVIDRVIDIADVFLLTSHYEGFGRVVVESFFCGTPVVSTDCGGPSEIIDNGVDGFIVRDNQARNLSEAVYKIISNPELKDNMSKNAREKASTKYRFEVLAECWVKLWIEVCSARKILGDDSHGS